MALLEVLPEIVGVLRPPLAVQKAQFDHEAGADFFEGVARSESPDALVQEHTPVERAVLRRHVREFDDALESRLLLGGRLGLETRAELLGQPLRQFDVGLQKREFEVYFTIFGAEPVPNYFHNLPQVQKGRRELPDADPEAQAVKRVLLSQGLRFARQQRVQLGEQRVE